ncbi:MAG: ATP-binding protein [Nitrospirota bacterium]
MKKKVIIGLGIFSIIFLIGGIYIIISIEKTTSNLEDILRLHQVELMREHLLLRLKRVQSDLYLRNTRYARGIYTIVSDVKKMEDAVDKCFKCHHPGKVMDRLTDIRNQVETYKNALSRIMTIRANIKRLEAEEDNAYMIGQELITTVDNMITKTSVGLTEKTQSFLRQMSTTKTIIFILVAVGPILTAVLSVILITSITKPLNVILGAIRSLKSGDMDYRIPPGLKDEFGEVASAFNEMTATLKDQMQKMQRTEQMAVCGQLAASLAHEIKNPLAAIKVAIEVISDELKLSKENQDTLSKVLAEVRRIESLMKNLLDFARPPKPQLIGIDINNTLDVTISFLIKQPSFSLKNAGSIKIVKEFDNHLPETMADPQQLQQVFMNLLLNSTDAMPDGGTLTVRTFYDSSTDSILIDISDTGKGISKDTIDKIFQPFFTTKSKGTGLGLAITRQLIEQHGGNIMAENNINGGATFKIKFPVKNGTAGCPKTNKIA